MDWSCTKEYWVDNKPTKYTKIAQSRRGVGAERREPPGEFIERFFTTIDVQHSDIVQRLKRCPESNVSRTAHGAKL
jgi:hypothetical protein